MKNLLLAAFIVFSFACSVNAQVTVSSDTESSVMPESSITSTDSLEYEYTYEETKENWFVSLHGGIGDLYSEQSTYVGLENRMTPTLQLSFGKWMTPIYGFRMSISGAKLKGFTVWNDATNTGHGSWYFGHNHPYDKNMNPTDDYIPAFMNSDFGSEIKRRYFGESRVANGKSGYMYEATYLAGTMDLVLSIANMIGSYDPDEIVDAGILIGVGYSHTFADSNRDQTAVNCVVGRGGAYLNFNVTQKFTLGIEGNLIFAPEVFDRRVGDGNTSDIIGSYMIGATYNF